MPELRARAWMLGDTLEFPEWELPWLRRRPNVGVCLSGGGTRSLCAAIGYLRGLQELGLLERVRYLAGVSGGAWAAVPYSFWERGPADDAELLGPILAPQQLDDEVLEAELPATELAACATRDFRGALFDDLLQEGAGAAWIGAVGEIFLAPFGLWDRARPRSYSLDEATRSALLAPQPAEAGLRADDFALLRPNRPFPVIQSTLLGPTDNGELRRFDAVSLQFTPLYVGCPVNLEVELDYLGKGDGIGRSSVRVQRMIGGGLIEPFAFGSAGPLEVSGAVHDYALGELQPTRELAFMAGTSSTAFAAAIQRVPELEAREQRRLPCAHCWPRSTDNGLETELWEVGDGGLIDNYGLLPLLQRGIETAIVLINTVQPLDLEYVPGQGSYKKRIDDWLPPLFGVCEDHEGLALARNQVFPSEELGELVAALQAAKRAGGPSVVMREHQLLDNAWWRIRGGRKLKVAWVYLDRVARFESLLPRETARAIRSGNRRPGLGPCQGFPNYDTIDQNFFELVQLTPYQVRLLTQLCSWIVLDQRELFESLFG
jgi:hypothetical protein